ncbi:MAG: hypothetical protein DMG97_17910 [Acidobacteria bacterium]|nr:MAG: hypothetical protein DMG97_17910 [Acidobacteriota bacterium]PYV79909.1 MAG: hypothetical protein DMG96_02415 [Acidobacteriota bacterium]
MARYCSDDRSCRERQECCQYARGERYLPTI